MRPAALTALHRWLAVAVVATLLSGCALPRMIDSEVESFAGSPSAIVGATYRFERLPSQQAQAAAQDQLEALAEPVLAQAGLVHSGTQARYSMQVEANVLEYNRAPQRQPRFGGGLMVGRGGLWYPSAYLVLEQPWYRHTVHLLMRDIATTHVVYESTARFDGPWSDSANLLPAILEAALRDFPNPPSGPRTVVVELPSDRSPAR